MISNSPLNLLVHDQVAFVAFVLALVVGITFHEFSHAAVATLQGDLTAKAQGRLTLNPISHIDPLGGLFLLIAGFGWGRPVPFVPGRLRSRRLGAALVGLAGPTANFVLAFVAAVLLRVGLDQGWAQPGVGGRQNFATTLVLFLFTFNVILGVFNLLPIPPLDGSRLLSIVLPPSRQNILYFLDRFGIFILLAILILAPTMLSPVFAGVQRFILALAGIHTL